MFRKLPLESDKDLERRSQAYTACWTDIRQRIEVYIMIIADSYKYTCS